MALSMLMGVGVGDGVAVFVGDGVAVGLGVFVEVGCRVAVAVFGTSAGTPGLC